MTQWPAPTIPALGGKGPAVRVFDSSTQELIEPAADDTARLYVCGITPYDATHMGHAATYLTFDLLNRAWRSHGQDVVYVQNVTDVDDPLLERAERDGEDWRDLAAREIALFAEDMAALRVIPPNEYVGVVASVAKIAGAVDQLLGAGLAYGVDVPDAGTDGGPAAGAQDVYLDLTQQDRFGSVSGWTREEMLAVFADRGGDPDRDGIL